MMTDGMDRDELIGLLGQLGDENDQTALSAARAIHAKVTAAERSWDDLLARPAPQGEEQDDDADESGDLPPVATGPVPDDAESLQLIEQMLGSKDLSEDLQNELGDYKADIEAGEFSDEDRRYLRALYQRLTKS